MRYRTITGVGTLAALLLVLAFGSPAYVGWVRDNADPGTAGGWFLHMLAWPSWEFGADESVRDVVAASLRAILVVALTAGLLSLLPGTQLARARGQVSQLLAGWAAYIFAGAGAALLASLIQSDPTLLGAFRAAGTGAAYGLFVGWIIGLATLGDRRGSRP